LLRIECRPPIALASGKVLHLHADGPRAHRREDG
jgi:hypothetical protein